MTASTARRGGIILPLLLLALLLPTTAAAAPDRPLILIPGTTGSYLGTDSNLLWLDATQLYHSRSDSFLDDLHLDELGQDDPTSPFSAHLLPYYGIDGVIGPVQACGGPANKFCRHAKDEYNVTVDLLQAHGYVHRTVFAETADQTLFLFPYDWRKGMIFNAEQLRAKIKHVQQVTGAASVDILAHSQGGVVTNMYLHAFGHERDVHAVVTLGTPYLGTPKFLGTLEFKEPCQVVYGGACILNVNEAAKLVRNWPGALELLPSPRYWEVAASPLVERVRLANGTSTREVQTYAGMLSRLAASKKNMTLIGQARDIHSTMDLFPAGSTQILRIAGVGIPTITQIEEEAYRDCLRLKSGAQTLVACRWKTRIRNHFGSGDGTVVKQSALVTNCRTGKALDNSIFASIAERRFIGHDELTHDPVTIGQAVNFFKLGATPPGPCPTAPTLIHTTGASSDDDPGYSGTVLRTTGPLSGSISDGNDETGTVEADLAVTGIGGSTFSASDDSADYATTADGAFMGTFTATDDGQVRLRLARYDADGVLGSAVSPAIAVKKGAVLAIAYSQPSGLSVQQVQVDDNGDGVVDRAVPFLQPIGIGAAEDATPPVASVDVHRVLTRNGLMARVTVTASDEGGAGVGEVRWSTTTGLEGTYTDPFLVPAQGDIEVVATDRAGNVQVDPAWGVLDDHTGVDFLVDDFDPVRHFVEIGLIDYPGDVDYHGVHVDGGRVKFRLAGLAFDGTLELDDGNGTPIATSANPGRRSEKIEANLPAGDYLLKVTGAGAAFRLRHPYLLYATRLGG
jgi:hypothetical protein